VCVFLQVKSADMIVVFEEGILLEQGNHDSLVAQGGLYAQLAGHKSSGAVRAYTRFRL
jgi:ATP-binding cassette subfamily B protein